MPAERRPKSVVESAMVGAIVAKSDDPESDREDEQRQGVAREDQEDERHGPAGIDPAEQPNVPETIRHRSGERGEDRVDRRQNAKS